MELFAVLIAIFGGMAVFAGFGLVGWVVGSLGWIAVVFLYDLSMVPVVGDPRAYRERERNRIANNRAPKGKEIFQALMKWLNGLVPGALTVMYINADSYLRGFSSKPETYQTWLTTWTRHLHWLVGWLHPIGPLTPMRAAEDIVAAQLIWLVAVWTVAFVVFLIAVIVAYPQDMRNRALKSKKIQAP